MKTIVIFILFFISNSIFSQSIKDTTLLKVQNEYLSIVVESVDSYCKIYISEDSTTCDKISLKDLTTFDLTSINGLLSKYSEKGWTIKSSNISMVGNSSPYKAYFYYLMERRK